MIDQIEYLNALDDVELKAAAQQILRNAYDEKLWGIQEGGTFQKAALPMEITAPPLVRDVPQGTITEGETFTNVRVPPTPLGTGRSGGVIIEGETVFPRMQATIQPRTNPPPGTITEGATAADTVGIVS